MIALLAGCGGDSVVKPDTTPPSAVRDLAVTTTTAGSVSLRWTAPGDDGFTGTAAGYDLRYATTPIDGGNFDAAVPATGLPAPQVAGTTQTLTIENLQPSTLYYVALVARDDAGNRSALSNVASGRTQPGTGQHRVFHATPDGTGSDCGGLQQCLNAAAEGDTVELAAGTYSSVADTLVEDGTGGPLVTVIMVARSSVVIRAAAGADVRVDGLSQVGRIGLSVPAAVTGVAVRGIRFKDCGAGIRTAGGRLVVRDCNFLGGSHGLVADDTELDVSGCRFESVGTEAALFRNCSGTLSASEFHTAGYGVFAAQSRGLLLERLLVAGSRFAGIRAEEGGTATLRSLTVAASGAASQDSSAIVVAGGASVSLDRCILAGNRGFGVLCRAGGQVVASCSDVFGNSAANFAGCPDPTGTNGNLSVDPLFCSPAGGDFHLRVESPARNSACGAMGAFGAEGCLSRDAEGLVRSLRSR